MPINPTAQTPEALKELIRVIARLEDLEPERVNRMLAAYQHVPETLYNDSAFAAVAVMSFYGRYEPGDAEKVCTLIMAWAKNTPPYA